MCESLMELRETIRKIGGELYFEYGEQIDIIKKICSKHTVSKIGFNLDYTPYARRRDEDLIDFCLRKKIEVITAEDYLLAPMGTFVKKDGNPYLVYGPFKDNALKRKVMKPNKTIISFEKNDITINNYIPKYIENKNILVRGGRIEGLKHLNIKKYEHDLLKHRTTELSAYIKYGCVSIREAYDSNQNSIYHQQLIWREFFFYIGCYFPDILDKSTSFKTKYDSIQWNHNQKWLSSWEQGKTGFPIIDACMSQINKTGYMHNRGRLISSNFLNRILGINWRQGEKYFATQLVDYDPLVNNGNWQWIASTGCDTKPYFQRLFNPWLQSERYDKDAEYIKEWLPQLKDIPAKHLHNWSTYYTEYDLKKIGYIAPIVDYNERRKISLKMYSSI
jgi:deoxyribodipyrimidine photo-lyase